MLFMVYYLNINWIIFQDDDLVKDELLDDQASDEPIDNERAVRNRRKIRKTD